MATWTEYPAPLKAGDSLTSPSCLVPTLCAMDTSNLGFEILGAGKRDWNLELGMGILASEQWESPKNQRPNCCRLLSIPNLSQFFVILLDQGAQRTTPQGRIKACCMTSARSS